MSPTDLYVTLYSLTAEAGTETDFPSAVRTYLLNQLIM
jgi:hypothetical protein